MIEYYGAEGALRFYKEFDNDFIEKLIHYTYELRRDPKERERENAEAAVDKLFQTMGVIETEDGRKFDPIKGLFVE